MRLIKEDKPCYGLNVKFKEEFEIADDDGRIMSIYLATRNTKVPFIVVAKNSEAKREGIDGIFAICSEKCGMKMKETINKELSLFTGDSSFNTLN